MRVFSVPHAHTRSASAGSSRTSLTGSARRAGFSDGRTRRGRGVRAVSSPRAVSLASSASASSSSACAALKASRSWPGVSRSELFPNIRRESTSRRCLRSAFSAASRVLALSGLLTEAMVVALPNVGSHSCAGSGLGELFRAT